MSVVLTGSTGNAWLATRYVFFGSGAQAEENRRTGHCRAVKHLSDLASTPENILSSTRAFGAQMRSKGRSVEALTLVHSFSPQELQADNEEHQELALQLAYELSERAYPGSLKTVVVHADADGGQLHTHTVVFNETETGRAIRANKLHRQVARLNDELMRENGLEVCQPVASRDSQAVYHAKKRVQKGTDKPRDRDAITWEEELKLKIDEALLNPAVSDMDALQEALEASGVEVSYGKRRNRATFKMKSAETGKTSSRRGGNLGTRYTFEGLSASIAEQVALRAQEAEEARQRLQEAQEAEKERQRLQEAEKARQRAQYEKRLEAYRTTCKNLREQLREKYPNNYEVRQKRFELTLEALLEKYPHMRPIHEAEEERRAMEREARRKEHLRSRAMGEPETQAQTSEGYGYGY